MACTLTKAEVISSVQKENGYSLRESSDIVEALLEIIKSTLESGKDVMISGFGKFQVKDKGERRGQNPATDEDMILPARRVVTLKCSGRLRYLINGG